MAVATLEMKVSGQQMPVEEAHQFWQGAIDQLDLEEDSPPKMRVFPPVWAHRWTDRWIKRTWIVRGKVR
jgi:hypothetical protein